MVAVFADTTAMWLRSRRLSLAELRGQALIVMETRPTSRSVRFAPGPAAIMRVETSSLV